MCCHGGRAVPVIGPALPRIERGIPRLTDAGAVVPDTGVTEILWLIMGATALGRRGPARWRSSGRASQWLAPFGGTARGAGDRTGARWLESSRGCGPGPPYSDQPRVRQ